jgi:hypothetical protein
MEYRFKYVENARYLKYGEILKICVRNPLKSRVKNLDYKSLLKKSWKFSQSQWNLTTSFKIFKIFTFFGILILIKGDIKIKITKEHFFMFFFYKKIWKYKDKTIHANT